MLFLAQETMLEGTKTALFPTLRLASTLVLYTYSNTDPEYEGNLRYFVKHGVAADDGCEYVIIVQQVWYDGRDQSSADNSLHLPLFAAGGSQYRPIHTGAAAA